MLAIKAIMNYYPNVKMHMIIIKKQDVTQITPNYYSYLITAHIIFVYIVYSLFLFY